MQSIILVPILIFFRGEPTNLARLPPHIHVIIEWSSITHMVSCSISYKVFYSEYNSSLSLSLFNVILNLST
jgi:hypothetical protein